MQQHRFHPGRTQARQLSARVSPAFFVGIQRKLLDLRTANGGVQVVVQTAALRQAEKGFSQMLKLTGPQGFGAAAAFVATAEQPVEVFFDKPRSGTHGAGVAEQEQNSGAGLDNAPRDGLQQAIKQLDRRCFIAMDAG